MPKDYFNKDNRGIFAVLENLQLSTVIEYHFRGAPTNMVMRMRCRLDTGF